MSTTNSRIGGKSFNIGISSSKLIVSKAIPKIAVSGLVTFFSVQGNLPSPNASLNNLNLRENDILKVGVGTQMEEVKILNVDAANSRIRVLRNQNNLSDAGPGVAHTITTTIEEDPRKFKIDVGFNTDFNNKVDFEYYFNPVESVGVGTTAGPGIGTTATILNPGGGPSQVFLPTRSIRLPNHRFKTGDQVTYHRNTGNALGIATNRARANLFNVADRLREDVPLFVARLSDDFIGLSTVKIGLGTAGDGIDPEDVFTGIGVTLKQQSLMYFTGIGTGKYHSLRRSYNETVKGSIEKNLVTVSARS